MGCRCHIKGVLLFAMLGVIANLAVAWMFAYSTLAPYSTLNAPLVSPTRIERWPVPVPDHWPGNAAIVDRWVNSGFERREMTASARTIETNTTPAAITTYSMSITLAGWPLTAFAAARLETLQRSTNAASPIQQTSRVWGIEIEREQSPGFAGLMPRLLPLYPALPGFLVNTLLYALTLGLLWALPVSLIRRRRRRLRGCCAKCGYDLRGAPHERCPECGAAIAVTSTPSQPLR